MRSLHQSTAHGLLTLACQDDMAHQGLWLLDLVASRAEVGPGLADGTTVQVGWSVLTLAATAGGTLEVREPAFDSDPLAATRADVSTTLRVLAAQTELLRRVGSEGLAARFDDKVIVQKGCLAEPGIYAQRSQPSPGDSGWYVGLADGPAAVGADDLRAIRLFQLLTLRPGLLAAMALPVDWMCVWQGEDIRGIADDRNQERWARTA
jgi:hypothetical protein